MSDPARVDALTVRYGSRTACEDVSFGVPRGAAQSGGRFDRRIVMGTPVFVQRLAHIYPDVGRIGP